MATHAVVIGASMAGLSAARVLADRFGAVTVLDRDDLPGDAVPRRGVPQGNHGHVLLVSGLRALTELFPGLPDELIAAGATRLDTGADMITYRFGRRWQSVATGLDLISASRPQLEAIVRARVMALPRVVIRSGAVVAALTGDKGGITGVRLDDGQTLDADLVVDASGRGSRSDRWLSALDWPVPAQVEIKIGIAYATRLYRRVPGEWPGFRAALVLPDPRVQHMAGIVLPIEGDRWLVALGGWHLDRIPDDAAGFEEGLRALPDPVAAEVIAGAEPITDPMTYRFPSSRRRLFEKLDRLPAGYVALGDSICSFNPIYGQGMTCAAMEAHKLGARLDEFGGATAEMAAAYYRDAAEVISIPWQFGAGGDFAYARTAGPRPRGVGFTNWYARNLAIASQFEPDLNRTFSRVQQLVDPPANLFKPSVVARTLWWTVRRAISTPSR
jgi:2-polyprenyl-6-methoxyphenol hydroxylase-like FAD-dependent oxidoreductase